MRYWLMKSEPDVFSIDDLKKKRQAPWDGVRNFQARNHMREMKVGDLVLFYHSSTQPPGVAGVARVCREAHPDPTAWDKKSEYFDPRSTAEKPLWDLVDVEFVEKLPRLVSLDQIKADPALNGMEVTKKPRLSVQRVDPKDFNHILVLARNG